ncbi:hypothetical protein, partial [Enterococcus faecalis]|uniref:hypothetical protein n=1 Tax=Enterococcus faecalis TaxID=1351 RepID=UPI003D0EAB00
VTTDSTVFLGEQRNKVLDYIVKVGDNTIPTDKYTIEELSTGIWDTIGVQNKEVKVTFKEDPTHPVTKTVPVTVNWGNSIIIRGMYDATRVAFPLLNGPNGPVIVATSGENPDNAEVHSFVEPEKGYYYKLDWFDLSNQTSSFKLSDTIDGTKGLKVYGTDKRQDSMDKWGKSRTQSVHHGDVIRVYDYEPSRNMLYENNEEKNCTLGKNNIYYEITKDGYRPLSVNQLTVKDGPEVPIYASHEYLDKHLGDYIDLTRHKNIRVSKWSQYPDTTSIGQKKGKLLVEETLESGKKVDYEYEVSASIDNSEVTVTEEKDALLGEVQSTSYNYVVKSNTQLVSADRYTIEELNTGIWDTIGVQNKEVKVTFKEDPTHPVTKTVPVTVNWGNSIIIRGMYDATRVAFPLLNGPNGPVIVATSGENPDNAEVHSFVGPEKGYYYKLDWFDLSNQTSSFKLSDTIDGTKGLKVYGTDKRQDSMDKWGKSRTQSVHHGDVIRVYDYEPSRNMLYENNEEKNCTLGKNNIYYEITKDGYRPLSVNQLTVKDGPEVPIYASHEYLDKHSDDFIEKGTRTDIKTGWETYPDVCSSGNKEGIVYVEEPLTSGRKVRYDYKVKVTVGAGSLDFSIPQTLTFCDFGKSEQEQIIQRKYKSGEEAFGLTVTDSRGKDSQGGWQLTAKVKDTAESLAPYLIFKDKSGAVNSLNEQTIIHSEEKETTATKPLVVEVSQKWTDNDGILLRVPSTNPLTKGKHQATIVWNLAEVP